MRSVLQSAVRPAVAGTLLCALAGCGGDSVRPPVVVVTPVPVRGIIAQTSFSGFDSGVWVGIDIGLSQRGKVDITVDWTFTDTWMYVYFGAQSCGYPELAGGKCAYLLSSETKDPKPRVLYTGNLDAGTYHLYLYNVPHDPRTHTGSDNTETVSLQVGLTVGAEGRAPGTVRLGPPTVLVPPRL